MFFDARSKQNQMSKVQTTYPEKNSETNGWKV